MSQIAGVSLAGTRRQVWRIAVTLYLEEEIDEPKASLQDVARAFGTLKSWMGATFPNEEITECKNGDEPARAGLQPQTRDADPRGRTPDDGHEGMKCPSFLFRIRITNKTSLPSRANHPDCI